MNPLNRRKKLLVVVVITITSIPLLVRASSGPVVYNIAAIALLSQIPRFPDSRIPSIQKPPRLAPTSTLLKSLYKWIPLIEGRPVEAR